MRLHLSGYPGACLRANTEQWLCRVLIRNPGLFDAFADPDRPEIQKCMWHGEFPGKLLTGMAQSYLCLGTEELLHIGNQMVKAFADCQKTDGYLGPWDKTGRFDGDKSKWDTWGHYHCILGLYRWYQATGNGEALAIAKKALDCVYHHFIEGRRTVVSQNWAECNLAISHAFVLFYQETGESHYLETAQYLVDVEWKLPYDDFFTKSVLCCDWMGAAEANKPFFRSNQPRWESLHAILTLGILYEATDDRRYYDALTRIWDSIAAYDVHNFGGFGTEECAQGKPYRGGSETCNTVAWMALSVEYLRLSHRTDVADMLERSYWNAAFGSMMSDTDFSYMNNMSGNQTLAREVLHDHGFLGGEEMSCCQANGNRGISMVSDWALLPAEDGFYLNYYGSCALEATTPAGVSVQFVQQTDYPKSGKIRISVALEQEERFSLYLRIPGWSSHNVVSVNGSVYGTPSAGSYFVIDRSWKNGDEVSLSLDVRLRRMEGEQECAGKTALFYGPILLAFPIDAVQQHLKAATFRALRFLNTPDECLSGIAMDKEQEIPFFAYADAGRKKEPFETWITILE